MNNRVCRVFAVLVLTLGMATGASATTEAELLNSTASVMSSVSSLAVRVQACPGGACAESEDILADFDALDVELQELVEERATLQNCGCTLLDSMLDLLEGVMAVLGYTLGGFGDQS